MRTTGGATQRRASAPRSSLVARLGRVTTTGRVIPQIDGLRFVAIAWVIVFHVGGYVAAKVPVAWNPPLESSLIRSIITHGNNGVQLFFAISGFILALPFASSRLNGAVPPRLPAYYLRRVTRLEPPYVLTLLAFFALGPYLKATRLSEQLPHLLASLVYQHNVIYGDASTVNGIAWSLEVEIQFYLLAPLLALIFAIKRRWLRRALMAALWIAAVGVKTWIAPHSRLELSLLNYFDFFWVGFILAELYVVHWSGGAARSGSWDLVSLVGWPAVAVLWSYDAASTWLFSALTLLLYSAALRGRRTAWFFGQPWIVVLGGMCYSIYLTHYAAVSAVGRVTQRWFVGTRYDVNFVIHLALFLPVILTIGVAVYVFVERPCMNPAWPRIVRTWLAARLGRATPIGEPG